jgi:hypothetical protein
MVVTRSASMSEKVLWGRGACRTGIERRALGAKAGVHTADAYCPQPYFNRVRGGPPPSPGWRMWGVAGSALRSLELKSGS